jgi:uncharacterized protein
MKTCFRVVPDTNVVIASEKARSTASPNREFFQRWKRGEFEILHSDDTLLEYIQTMREANVPENVMRKLIRALLELGRHIRIVFYHLPLYPSDLDDIAFLLCAENGNATHIVTYDSHFEKIDHFYNFRVCGTLDFLFELRQHLAEKG